MDRSIADIHPISMITLARGRNCARKVLESDEPVIIV